MDAELGQSSYFARGEQSFYAEKRTRNDFGWTIAYCLWAALTVFWGIAAFTHTDPNAADYTNSFFWNSATCNIDEWKAYQATLPPTDIQVDPTFGQAFNQQISIWLPISAVVALVCSAVYVLLFRKYAKTMVYLSIYFSLGCSAAWAILCLAFGAVPFGIILLIVTIISAVFYWWIRNQLAMCAKLMSVAGRGLSDNVGLVPASLGIKVGGLAVLVYALAAFGSAVNIGTVGANSMVTSRTVLSNTNGQAAVCLDAQGMEVSCCSMNTAGWAGAYCFVCAIFILWTWMIVMQIRLYTVADTTAQWYFSATGSSASVGSAANAPGSVRLALRNAMTTSFGSIAFAAAILTALRIIRNTMRRCARDNIICCIINCLVQPLLALAEKFTSFATIAVAITGKSFVAAATSVFETLKRNFLQTYSVWWVPEMVLNTAAFLVSLAWAGLVYFGAYLAKKDVGVGFLVAFICFFAMWFVLQFVAGLLLDIVNTLYICYAMDRDAKKVTHAEIHAIYNEVPTIAGGVVVNPDGGVMYGAADQQQQQLAPQQVVVQMHPVAPPPYPGAAPQPAYGAPAGYPAPGAYPGYAPVATAQPAAPYPAVQPAGGSYQPFPTDKL